MAWNRPGAGDREAASDYSAFDNVRRISREMAGAGGRMPLNPDQTTDSLRQELRAKGIQGFRHGGRVKRTGIYRLHAGERVIPARGRRRGRR